MMVWYGFEMGGGDFSGGFNIISFIISTPKWAKLPISRYFLEGEDLSSMSICCEWAGDSFLFFSGLVVFGIFFCTKGNWRYLNWIMKNAYSENFDNQYTIAKYLIKDIAGMVKWFN